MIGCGNGQFTLAGEYLDTMVVLPGLTLLELQRPGLFNLASRFLGRTGYAGEFVKFTSGQFVAPESGNPLPSNPLEWPAGHAVEVGIGPWNFQNLPDAPRVRELIGERMLKDADYSPALESCILLRETVVWLKRNPLEVLTANGQPDWSRTFALDGPNGAMLQHMDRAEWRVYRPGDEPAQDLQEDPEAEWLTWSLGSGSSGSLPWSVTLTWNPLALIDGALVTWKGGWWPEGRQEGFPSVPQAISAISLDERLTTPFRLVDVAAASSPVALAALMNTMDRSTILAR